MTVWPPKFQDLLLSATDRHVPRITLRGRSRPPWITAEVMKLIRKKKALWKKIKINSSPDLFMRFKQLRKQTKKCIATNYHQYLQSLSEKLKVDPKKFWSFHAIRSKTRRLPVDRKWGFWLIDLGNFRKLGQDFLYLF